MTLDNTNLNNTNIDVKNTDIKLTTALDKVVNRIDLTEDEMASVMQQIMTGNAPESLMAALLTALRMKGESISEITGAAKVMRTLSLKVDVADVEHLVDIVGTGGDGKHLFNVSTASAFVAAAAGAHVAKHGNRGVSSSSGSSDLLEQAGITLNLDMSQTADCIRDIGVGFLYAPNHHKAMKYAMPVRKTLAMRSIFNLLGPLTNPAGVKHLVVGVFNKALCEPLAKVLHNLGAEHVMVVHADDGLDEISIAASTHVAELKDGVVNCYDISPESLGLTSQTLVGLSVASKKESLQIIKGAFARDKAKQSFVDESIAHKAADMISLNAGAAIYVAGICDKLSDAVQLAQDILASGQAMEKLQNMAEYTKTIIC